MSLVTTDQRDDPSATLAGAMSRDVQETSQGVDAQRSSSSARAEGRLAILTG
ncbi:hypothetical protein [uncultured Nocardioides sp.]|uniref:hypothetical protein n=1 Tax=uncultured Nocardioides sp. TaxID=198441 RepID=UPI002600CAEC|nr:hypothetical protein [uncultured Nocardioides sp.]